MSSSAVGKKKKGFAANIKSKIRGFFGSRPFSAVNEFLVQHGEAPVRW